MPNVSYNRLSIRWKIKMAINFLGPHSPGPLQPILYNAPGGIMLGGNERLAYAEKFVIPELPTWEEPEPEPEPAVIPLILSDISVPERKYYYPKKDREPDPVTSFQTAYWERISLNLQDAIDDIINR
jgi:hypothetical protein